MKISLLRRTLLASAAVVMAMGALAPAAHAQNKVLLRISTPAVPDDWHAKMWTVFKENLDKSAPGEFDVQINLNASLFKQGTEPAAMARGNLELSSISAFDIAKLVPEFRSSPQAMWFAIQTTSKRCLTAPSALSCSRPWRTRWT